MDRKELQELFSGKISLELERFKDRMLKQEPEVIYQNAYRIDCMVCIYEVLADMGQKISEDALKALLMFPNLLAFLYAGWLKQEDSHEEELNHCMSDAVLALQNVYRSQKALKGENAA